MIQARRSSDRRQDCDRARRNVIGRSVGGSPISPLPRSAGRQGLCDPLPIVLHRTSLRRCSLLHACARRPSRSTRRRRATRRRATGTVAIPAGGQLVESGHQPGAGRCAIGAVHLLHQQRRRHAGCIPISAATVARQRRTSTASRTSSSSAINRSARCSSTTPTRATASITRPGAAFRSIPFPTKRSRSRTGSKAASRAAATPGGDRHMLIVDRDNRHLYELYDLRLERRAWTAGSGAFFDLNANDAAARTVGRRRTRQDWRFCRASCATTRSFGADEIRHAFRVTVRATNGYVWPASHRAGSNSQALPMGARLRLKASKDLSRLHAGGSEDFPRDAALRPDRRGQRIRHVHQRRVRSALEQRRAQSGVPRAERERLRRDRARLARRRPSVRRARRRIAIQPFRRAARYVVLVWAAAAGAQDYMIEVGSAPGLSNLLVTPLGRSPRSAPSPRPAATSRAFAHGIRCGLGTASNEIVVTI